jgi:glutathione synthase/RimK-type ligase-like ATP-grasp enzyme
MRILLSEGSGLTSRQVAGQLGSLGHTVEILSSSKICLTRFTRHAKAVHDVPRFGLDPFGWLAAAERIAAERKTDLLFPTQEQVTVLSARQKYLRVATIVPPFGSLARVQDKISAFRTLKAIGAPQPQTFVISSADDLRQVTSYPVFVKRPVSTASSGVRRATNAQELVAAARAFGLGQSELIAQSQASGPLAMVQAVADRGRLVAHHACLRLREGVGGGASLKESVALPGLAETLARLVAALEWHGALSMDVIVVDSGPVIIDVNPRLVEPANALAAGVDLVAAMLDVAHNAPSRQRSAGSAGVRTRQTLLGILVRRTPRHARCRHSRSIRGHFRARRLCWLGRGTDAGRGRSRRGGARRRCARCVTDPPAAVAEISRWRGRPLRSHAGGVGQDFGGGRVTSAVGT